MAIARRTFLKGLGAAFVAAALPIQAFGRDLYMTGEQERWKIDGCVLVPGDRIYIFGTGSRDGLYAVIENQNGWALTERKS